MSYEIPQSLRYKERIVFNLNLEQTLYATLFGTIAFFILVKTSFSIYARVALALIPIGIGLLFMYLDLWHHLRNYFAWFRFRKKTSMLDSRMKKYLKLYAVENSCYYLEHKPQQEKELEKESWLSKKLESLGIKTKKNSSVVKRVAVLRVEPLNFKIKPKDERDAIIYNFQKFLNALDFPIQVSMYTDDLNLNKYLNELEYKTKNSNNLIHLALFKAHQKYLEKSCGNA